MPIFILEVVSYQELGVSQKAPCLVLANA
jgi:hypothetical protein